MQGEMTVSEVQDLFERARREIAKAFVGQEELVEGVLVALFAEGSVLIEGVPGLGKTFLVNVLARVLSCKFRRVQFTPDLMPSDLTGHTVYDLNERRFHFNPGPVFTNLLLADEINRSPPKTQAALLEVMQELQVTVDGTTHRLERPFFVLATQNPIEHEGTYPLPEAQVDRFLFKLHVGYPPREEEERILEHFIEGRDPRRLDTFGIEPAMEAGQVIAIQRAASRMIVETRIRSYITEIVSRTRSWDTVSVGASPRGSIHLLLGARTLAACRGRDYVTPDDVRDVAPWALRHRILLRPEAEIEGVTADDVIGAILDTVEVPRS